MHEFSVAQDIIGTLKTNFKGDFHRIKKINISLGKFSGIVTDSLNLGLETYLKIDGIENVEISYSYPIAKAKCECGFVYEFDDIFYTCPECNSLKRELLSGDEVIIQTIEIKE